MVWRKKKVSDIFNANSGPQRVYRIGRVTAISSQIHCKYKFTDHEEVLASQTLKDY